MVEKDVKNLKATLTTHLQKQYKRHDEYPFIDILAPRLKIIEVPIRPAYKEENATFPMSKTVTVPVPLVYGETDQGFFECQLTVQSGDFRTLGHKTSLLEACRQSAERPILTVLSSFPFSDVIWPSSKKMHFKVITGIDET